MAWGKSRSWRSARWRTLSSTGDRVLTPQSAAASAYRCEDLARAAQPHAQQRLRARAVQCAAVRPVDGRGPAAQRAGVQPACTYDELRELQPAERVGTGHVQRSGPAGVGDLEQRGGEVVDL